MNRSLTAAAGVLTAVVAISAFAVLTPASAAPADGACNHTVIIGDSLTAYGNRQLHALLPTATVNARGGRTTSEGWEAAEGILESSSGWEPGNDGPHGSEGSNCWVFALGTNDVYDHLDRVTMTAAIHKLLSLAAPTDHVWWVLPVFGPATDLDPTAFIAAIPSYVTLIDTHPTPTDFLPDDIHYTQFGYIHRADVIATAVTP